MTSIKYKVCNTKYKIQNTEKGAQIASGITLPLSVTHQNYSIVLLLCHISVVDIPRHLFQSSFDILVMEPPSDQLLSLTPEFYELFSSAKDFLEEWR